MKLEELLGAELYAQVQARIDEVNANEPDKLKHVRFADLSEGGYVARAKHEDLENKFKTKDAELTSANALIEQFRKEAKGNEELQGQISAYEEQVTKLQEELAETKVKSAIQVALMSAGASDVDYLTFKLNESLKEKGEKLELDDNDNIKNWDSRLEGLKTQYPKWFEAGDDGSGYVPIENKGLPKGGKEQTVTKEQFMQMSYEQRAALKKSNEKLYESLSK